MIKSIKNTKVKNWKKLHKRKTRWETKTFLIEGFHLLEEAVNSHWNIREVIVQHDINLPGWCHSLPIVDVSEQVFRQISRTETPQGIAAVVEMKEARKIKGNHILMIDAVQDPGNVGTMIRTADASGFAGVITGSDTADMYNDKVIRATQGSLFHIPVLQRELKDEVNRLKQNGFQVWAAALEDAEVFHHLDIPEKTALIVGNEGAGIKEALLSAADKTVQIPIYGKAESLNVSVAAGILMYYLKR